MTLTDRDRRILIILIPIVLIVGYWFLLLSPKRDDLKAAQENQEKQEQRLQAAQDRVAQLEAARQTFAADYAAVVRLGKAIPAAVDAPSLLLQLDEAAEGTRIDFNSVTFGQRSGGVAVPASPPRLVRPSPASRPRLPPRSHRPRRRRSSRSPSRSTSRAPISTSPTSSTG